MKFIIAILSFLVISFALMSDADAGKRLGGGKSTGIQRDSVQRDAGTVPKPATPPTQAAPAGTSPAATPMPAPSGASRWLGPLAGLAAGGLLASLFMGGGFDGIKLMDILLIGGLLFVGLSLFRMMMRNRTGSTGPIADTQYTGSLGEPAAGRAAAPNDRLIAPEIGSRLSTGTASAAEVEAATANPRIPAEFEVAPFEREARTAFIRLQAANDRGDLDDIRDFSTPEMFAELAVQIQERGEVAQRTEVVSLAVNVLEVATENNRAIASVRYTGTIRDAVSALPETFDEVWHVVKNLADPKSTWQLAGIQQLA
ncbi:MAG TPA: TIM44-like domain-containing protein [Usitatibacteraceae bacterium]